MTPFLLRSNNIKISLVMFSSCSWCEIYEHIISKNSSNSMTSLPKRNVNYQHWVSCVNTRDRQILRVRRLYGVGGWILLHAWNGRSSETFWNRLIKMVEYTMSALTKSNTVKTRFYLWLIIFVSRWSKFSLLIGDFVWANDGGGRVERKCISKFKKKTAVCKIMNGEIKMNFFRNHTFSHMH